MTATKRSRVSIFLALATASGLCAEAYSATAQKVPLPRPRPAINTAKQTPAASAQKQAASPSQQRASQNAPALSSYAQAASQNSPGLSPYAQANVAARGAIFETRTFFKPLARPTAGPFSIAPTEATSAAGLAAVTRVIDAALHGEA